MNTKFVQFVGCPHAFCRNYICETYDISRLTTNGMIVTEKRVRNYEEDGMYLLCKNCEKIIGMRREEMFLEFFRCIYSKEVRTISKCLGSDQICEFLDIV